MRMESDDKLVLDSSKAFLRGRGGENISPDKEAHDKWAEKYAGKDAQGIAKVIQENLNNIEWCNNHKDDDNAPSATLDKLNHYVKKDAWLEKRKRELEGGAGGS